MKKSKKEQVVEEANVKAGIQFLLIIAYAVLLMFSMTALMYIASGNWIYTVVTCVATGAIIMAIINSSVKIGALSIVARIDEYL